MKVAILSESEVDDAAVRILVDAILEVSTEPVGFRAKARGWTGVRDSLPTVLKSLHYTTDAEALVVVVDSDDSAVHQSSHEQPCGADSKCRLCLLREAILQTSIQLQPVTGRVEIKTAVGLAVPAIESWFLCGNDSSASEAAWLQGGFSTFGSDYRKRLKQKLYGKMPVSSLFKAARMKEESARLAANLSLLESHFPNGFGALANAIRNW